MDHTPNPELEDTVATLHRERKYSIETIRKVLRAMTTIMQEQMKAGKNVQLSGKLALVTARKRKLKKKKSV